MRKLVGFWLLSLAVAGMLASAVTAQINRQAPSVVSGGDLGFRIEGTDTAGRPVGELVIRVNGQWVDVGTNVKATPAFSK